MVAAIDGAEALHVAARRVLEEDRGPFLLSPLVLAEADYMIGSRYKAEFEVGLLREVAEGFYRLEPFGPDDVAAAAAVIEQYRDLGIGLTDASIVVIAARASTTRILTLDERHFRAIRPLRGRAFTLLPTDV